MMNKFIIIITLSILSFQSSEARETLNKLLKKDHFIKSDVKLDPNLAESEYKLDHYPNILGYKNDEYLLLYGNNKTWLYDMDGNQHQEWRTNIKRAQLLKNCNLMVVDNNQNHYIAEKNPDGKIAWKYKVDGITHHDFEISKEGTIVFLYHKPLSKDFYLTNGCSNDEVMKDIIIEIDRNGNKLFEWDFEKHYGKALNNTACDAARRERMSKSKYSHETLDWAHPNSVNILRDNKWFEAGYKEFKPNNLLVTVHHMNRIIIIDKSTGKVVWLYKGDELGLDYPHEAKIIPKGYPGAGNILIYDNGVNRKYTRIIEINPINKKIVWEYKKPKLFFNKWAGSQQRLKNGDTFISDDGSARAFIVNKEGKTKWQFTKHDMKFKWVKRAHLYDKKDFAHCMKGSK